MSDSASTPRDVGQPGASPAPPPDRARAGAEGIQEIVLCSDDGQILYEWPSSEAAARVQLFDPLFKFSEALAGSLSLGRVGRLEVQMRNERMILLLQPNRRLLVRSSGKRGTT
jgi:hypothetical protein